MKNNTNYSKIITYFSLINLAAIGQVYHHQHYNQTIILPMTKNPFCINLYIKKV